MCVMELLPAFHNLKVLKLRLTLLIFEMFWNWIIPICNKLKACKTINCSSIEMIKLDEILYVDAQASLSRDLIPAVEEVRREATTSCSTKL